MELIQSEQPKIAVEAEPQAHTASLPIEKTEHGQTWLRTLAVILVGLVLVVLIVLFARWIYHRSHHAVVTAPTTAQQSTAKSSSKTSTGAQPATNGSNGSSGLASQPASGSSNSSAPQSGTSSSGTSTQITNTGPGDIAAIFISTSLAAASLHYVVTTRRQQA